MKKISFILIIPFLACSSNGSRDNSTLLTKIATGSNIEIDGHLSESAWKNANTCQIKIKEDWLIIVKTMQDEKESLFRIF